MSKIREKSISSASLRPSLHLTLNRPKGSRISARPSVAPPLFSPLRQELVAPFTKEGNTESYAANPITTANSSSSNTAVFPDPSACGLESLCRLTPNAKLKDNQNPNMSLTSHSQKNQEWSGNELFQDESSSTDFIMVMANSNLVRYCEGEVEVRVHSSRFQTKRFIGIYSNHLFIYKSPKDRGIMFKIKLDASTKIQRSRKVEFGICLYHYDQKLGKPLFCTITAQDRVHQDSWIKSLISAKQASRNPLF